MLSSDLLIKKTKVQTDLACFVGLAPCRLTSFHGGLEQALGETKHCHCMNVLIVKAEDKGRSCMLCTGERKGSLHVSCYILLTYSASRNANIHSHTHTHKNPVSIWDRSDKMSLRDTHLSFKHFTWKGTNYDFLVNYFDVRNKIERHISFHVN